jgi:hypothetical protein
MPRTIDVPAQTIHQEIRSLEEIPSSPGAPGFVRVQIGRVDETGAFLVPQQFDMYEIRGKMYEALVGAPAEWAPDKPAGTYRNEDLWYFIDRIREATVRAAALQRELEQL